ncbi:MAG: glycosyltransferase family 39 protein [Verrucomicrobiota bacterium]|nr:glycosyltransferase family 39 protein [Verrucomicrobiota bacterium]
MANRNYALVFFAALIFHLAGTWSLPFIDRDEPRFAEASREMSERHDFVVPFFNNEPRYDKPPLTYWAQIASFHVFGENDFGARFPTAVAAALTAVALFGWGKRLRDERVGWWAAAIFTLSLQVFVHSKAAVADLWLVLFVTLAHRAAYELMAEESDRRRWWWIFYFSLAFAFLAKGPIGWVPLLTVAVAKRFHRGENFRARFHFGRGLLLTLAIVCAWGIPALLRTHGEFFAIGIGKHVLGRSVSTMEGHGASGILSYVALLPFYFVAVFVSFFPWSIKLPALCRSLRDDHDRADRFLIAGTLVVFVVFTFVATKLPHYTLPAFPLLALLLAKRTEELKLSRTLAVGAAVFLFGLALATPLAAKYFPSYVLADVSRPDLQSRMEFAAVDFTEPSLVWYFRKHIRGFMTTLRKRKAAEFMTRPGARFIVLPTNEVAELFPDPQPTWQSYRTIGFNIPKLRCVDVTMLIKSE